MINRNESRLIAQERRNQAERNRRRQTRQKSQAPRRIKSNAA